MGRSGRSTGPRAKYRESAGELPTIHSMNIVIATAEPLGAYHLVPLYPAMGAATLAGHSFTHLIPYPEKVQGEPWRSTSADLSVLEAADLVVLTGGGYTAWTELLARECVRIGVRFVITELAYGAQSDGQEHPRPMALSAMSPAGAANLSRYHNWNQGDIVITGTPLLDDLPVWQPVVDRVLLLSSVESDTRDPDGVLKKIAGDLVAAGKHVVVRCHPREDRSIWDGFELDTSTTPARAASNAEIVIGYPGSAHPIAAAIGVPVVAVAPTAALRDALPTEQASVIPTWITDLSQVELLSHAVPTSASVLYATNGPSGNSGERVVEFWLGQL